MLRDNCCTLRGLIRARWAKRARMGLHNRQQYGSSVAATGAVNSDIERYIELA